MRVKTFYGPTLIFLVCLPAVVLTAPDSPDTNERPAVGKPVEGFLLSLRSAKTEYTVGDKIEIQMTVRNTDTKDRKVVDADPLFIFDFHVKGPDGKTLPLNKRGSKLREIMQEFGRRSIATLKPQDELTFSQVISEIFDLQELGEYQIGATMNVRQEKNPETWSKLTSNTLTLTITEAKEKKDK